MAAFAKSRRAEVFRVAHHGSRNADYDKIWNELLHLNAHSVVTPFSSGEGLPMESDLERLASRTENLYLTFAGSLKPPKRDRTVKKQILNIPRRALAGTPGHVRIRWRRSEERTIEFFNGALKIATERMGDV
jgi:hypothetical protein